MQLCNKYLLKTKRKVISLDNSEIQQLLFFFSLLTWALRVWGNISSLFLVILCWRLCSSGISNLTSSPICRNELFMEKNNPFVEFTVFLFFLSSVFGVISHGWKSQAFKRTPIGARAGEHHFFISYFVVIKCLFVIHRSLLGSSQSFSLMKAIVLKCIFHQFCFFFCVLVLTFVLYFNAFCVTFILSETNMSVSSVLKLLCSSCEMDISVNRTKVVFFSFFFVRHGTIK